LERVVKLADDFERSRGELLAAVSNMVVAVYADHLGRGPTKARTYMHDNVVISLLENSLTRAEHLVGAGRSVETDISSQIFVLDGGAQTARGSGEAPPSLTFT
jgi:Na+-translocating membrane potential-generating system (MpsC)